MASARVSLIHYTRTGGRLPPRDRELLDIYQDASFDMWRSVGAASQPPSPVGRFAGKVPAELIEKINQLADRAAAAGNLAVTPPPDASIDRIQVSNAQARMGRHDQPEGPWGALAETLRQALGQLTRQPAAVIALEVDPSGSTAQLVHQGTEALQVDLRNLQVRAVLWEQRKKVGDWRWKADAADRPDEYEAGPDWSFTLPFEHGFSVTPGQEVAAYVTAALYDGELLVPVSLEARSRK